MQKYNLILIFQIFLFGSNMFSQNDFNEVFFEKDMNAINEILMIPEKLDSLFTLVVLNSNSSKVFDEQMKRLDEDIFQNKKVLVNAFTLGTGLNLMDQSNQGFNSNELNGLTPRINFSFAISPKVLFSQKSDKRKLYSTKEELNLRQKELKKSLRQLFINILYDQLLALESLKLIFSLMEDSEQNLNLMKIKFRTASVTYFELQEVQDRYQQIKVGFYQEKFNYLKLKNKYKTMLGN